MAMFARFDADGAPAAFYADDIDYPAGIPADAVEITAQQWEEFVNNPMLRRWKDGDVVVYEPPMPEPGPIVLFPADLWRRTTEEEAEQIEAAMNAQSARLRNLFRTAQTYQSDDPLWPVLEGAAVQLFGEERAAELLAAS